MSPANHGEGWFSGSPLHAKGLEDHAVPKAWGTVKSAVGGEFVFEDAGGTIRMYDATKRSITLTLARQ